MYLGTQYNVTNSSYSSPKPLLLTDYYKDINDWSILNNPHEDVTVFSDTHEIQLWTTNHLEMYPALAYVTGGFQASLPQLDLIAWLDLQNIPVLLGLEPDSYIQRKGREPLMDLTTRKHLWRNLLPNHSGIFVVPENIFGEQYDELAKELGVFKRKGIIHIGNSDDSVEVKSARLNRCFDLKHYCEVSFGRNFHTSNYR